jgi:hypothetical protein
LAIDDNAQGTRSTGTYLSRNPNLFFNGFLEAHGLGLDIRSKEAAFNFDCHNDLPRSRIFIGYFSAGAPATRGDPPAQGTEGYFEFVDPPHPNRPRFADPRFREHTTRQRDRISGFLANLCKKSVQKSQFKLIRHRQRPRRAPPFNEFDKLRLPTRTAPPWTPAFLRSTEMRAWWVPAATAR